MGIADSSRGVLRYVEETNWGTTPTAALKTLRIVSESLTNTADYISSDEIVSDRQVTDVTRVKAGSAGDIECLVSYAALDDLLEGALMSDWALNSPTSGQDTLTNGTTLKSYTFEKEFPDADADTFQSFTGCRISTMGLTIQPGAVIRARLSVMGKAGAFGTATVGTGAAVAAPTNDVFNAVDHVTAISEGGSPIADVTNLSIDYGNALRAQDAIGSLSPIGIGAGTISCTGSMSLYFKNKTFAEKFVNDTESSIGFTLTDGAGNKYTVTLPKLKYTAGAVPLPGVSQDVKVNATFTAYKDTATGKTFKIVRDPA